MRARLHGPMVLAGCLMVVSTQDVLTPSGNLAEITYRSLMIRHMQQRVIKPAPHGAGFSTATVRERSRSGSQQVDSGGR